MKKRATLLLVHQEQQEQREGQRGEREEGKGPHRAQQRVTKVGVWEAVVMCLLKG
eukprot:34748_6